MKKNRVAFVCLLAISILLLTACGAKTFELKGITKIELTDGSNGKIVEVIEEEQIQIIIQSFANNEFKKGQSSSDTTGWSYRLKFYQDDNTQADITVMNNERISFDGYFYDTKDGTINIIYLDEILNKTEE